MSAVRPSPRRGRLAMLGAISLLVVIGGAVVTATSSAQPEPDRLNPADPPPIRSVDYEVVVPAGTYQSIVVSPPDGVEGGGGPNRDTIPFVIRARDAEGGVSDFAFYVEPGGTLQLDFPSGWTIPEPAALIAPEGVRFAAWGVSGNIAASGKPVRFRPIRIDAADRAVDRERERDYEQFLRDVARNR